jgi:hypothetical protein
MTVFAAGAVLAVVVVLAVAAIRRVGLSGVVSALWGGGLVLAGAGFANMLMMHAGSDPAAEQRVIERRAAELTERALVPGSALACLDAVASAVADACERALFSSPEATAAAVAYVDARFSLLVASVALAEHNAALGPATERLRSAIEADHFGLVAHVLMTRGCNGADCRDLKVLRDPARVLANIKSHAFEVRIGSHAIAWQAGSAGAIASTPLPSSSVPPLATTGPAAAPSATTASVPANNKRFDFPSAASIPAVSIMSAEPTTPPLVEAKPAAPSKIVEPPKAVEAPKAIQPSKRAVIQPRHEALPEHSVLPSAAPQAAALQRPAGEAAAQAPASPDPVPEPPLPQSHSAE